MKGLRLKHICIGIRERSKLVMASPGMQAHCRSNPMSWGTHKGAHGASWDTNIPGTLWPGSTAAPVQPRGSAAHSASWMSQCHSPVMCRVLEVASGPQKVTWVVLGMEKLEHRRSIR